MESQADMNTSFFDEPLLEFGVDRHVDARFGIMNYGPVDFDSELAPKEIRVGIVGTHETVQGVVGWLERCRDEIPAKVSRQPNLFPKFPGFRPDLGFQSTLNLSPRLQRVIPQRQFDELAQRTEQNQIVKAAVELFVAEFRYLTETTKPDVLICAVPQALLDVTVEPRPPLNNMIEDDTEGAGANEAGDQERARLDFHHLLKARCMIFNQPIQLIIPSTYDETKRRQRARTAQVKQPQDEATRAWNFHTALYYKAHGVPWRMVRDAKDLATCYVGVAFYATLDRASLMTSVAQIFNERGEGVVVRGGPAKISKEDRTPHLAGDDARSLLASALATYRWEHKTFPARVVVHKSSTFTSEEIAGFATAASAQQIEYYDLVSITDASTRLFRPAAYPPLRGTMLSLDAKNHVLYTRGAVDFFSTYPGLYVPRPLLFRMHSAEQTAAFLAQEILALTKMNWNNTQFDGGEPITLRAARQVGNILKYVAQDSPMATGYRHYM